MPSQISHALGGRKALEKAGILLPRHLDAAFNLGCQGPDIFSHNRRTKPFAIAYARMLHRGGYGRFCGNLARAIRESPFAEDSSVQSWFLGFVTHQEFDRSLHPYIINRSYVADPTGIAGVNPALVHAFFERILDVCILAAIEGSPVSSFDTGESFALPSSASGPIASLLAKALSETYEEPSSDSDLELRMRNAFTDSIFFYSITNPARTDMSRESGRRDIGLYDARGASGVALLYPESVIEDADWLNRSRLPWKNPADGALRAESAVDLFNSAVNRAGGIVMHASRILTEPCDNSAFDRKAEALAREIGDACLSIAGSDGKIAPVVASESSEVLVALEKEVACRGLWLSGEQNLKGRLS